MKTSREKYLESRITDAQEELAKARSQRLLRCPRCKRASRLKAWTLCEVQFYIQPYGCTGGDHWQFCEPAEYELTCPKCKKMSEFNEYTNEEGYALVHQYGHAFKQGGAVQRE